MRFGYGLSRLLGSVYGNGNVVFLPPDGTCVLSPVRNRVLLIDLVNHSSSVLPFESRKEIRLLSPSHDGRLLLVLDVDGRALLVNLQRRVVLHRFNFKKKIRAISFSPDDRFIAAGVGKKVEVWRTPGRRHQIAPLSLFRSYGGLQDDVTCLGWGPDSRHLVAGSKDATARVFFVNDTGESATFVPTTLAGHREGLRGCFVSASGDEVYSVAKDGGVFVWEWLADDDKIQLTGSSFFSGASMKGSVPKEKGSERVSKRTEGDETGDGDAMDENSEDFSDADRSSSEGGGEEEEEEKPADLGVLRTPANGKWRLVSKHFLRPGGSCNITSASFHATRSLLVLGFSSGVFGLYEMPESNAIHTLSVGQAGIGACDVNATGDWLAFGCARLGQLLVWEWQSETYVLKQQGHGYGLNCAAFGATGSVCATGGDDSKVKLWSTTSGFCFVTFSEHEAPVTAVRFTPNASAVLSASLDGTVRAHDLVRYKNFRTLVTPQPTQLTSLALDNSGEVVVAGAMDPFEVYVWSLQTGKLLDVLAGHEAPLSELSFSPNQGVLASASWDGTVKLWDVFKSECIETLEMPADVLAVTFRPDGRQLCCACLNGTLQLWGTDGGDLQGIIEGRRDIAGGRRAHDMVTAANSNHGKYFTSVDYTADGTCVVAAGQSKFVCIYECSQQILVKKFQISHNRSLDGVLDELHNKRLTEAGSLDMLEASDDSDGEGRYRGASLALPGAERGADGSSRRTREEARSTCVRFSPTGREWAACTTDGLLLYSLDEAAVFDPSDLDESVTPEAVQDAIGRKEWAKAVLMSLHLNERELREKTVDAVPMSEVALTASAVPAPYALRLLGVLADRLAHSPRLEFHLSWSLATLQSHGRFLRGQAACESRAAGVMRALQRALTSHQTDLFKLCQENQYTLSFLGAIDDAKDAKSGEVGADSATAPATTGPSAKRMRVP